MLHFSIIATNPGGQTIQIGIAIKIDCDPDDDFDFDPGAIQSPHPKVEQSTMITALDLVLKPSFGLKVKAGMRF